MRLHHCRTFKDLVKSLNIELIFNASYSSELNPIERLWALSKRRFGRELVAECDLRLQSEVKAFIEKSII